MSLTVICLKEIVTRQRNKTLLTGLPQPRVAHSALGGHGGGPAGRGPGHHQHEGGDRPLPLRRAGARAVARQAALIMLIAIL